MTDPGFYRAETEFCIIETEDNLSRDINTDENDYDDNNSADGQTVGPGNTYYRTPTEYQDVNFPDDDYLDANSHYKQPSKFKQVRFSDNVYCDADSFLKTNIGNENHASNHNIGGKNTTLVKNSEKENHVQSKIVKTVSNHSNNGISATEKETYTKESPVQTTTVNTDEVNKDHHDSTQRAIRFKVDSSNQAKLAYRDSDGKIKIYNTGEAPTYLAIGYNGAIEGNDANQADETTEKLVAHQESVGVRVDEPGRKFTVGDFKDIKRDADQDEVPTDSDDDKAQTGVVYKRVADIEAELADALTNPRPPRVSRRDLIPSDDYFTEIDLHAIKAPPISKLQVPTLVDYLIQVADTPLEKVRAFYMWITHNINYDTSGYFGRALLQSVDPPNVLQTRLTVCEGYTRLMEAMCEEVNIPVKILSGYVKAYGYVAGKDVTKDKYNAHAWNAVYLEHEWFLLDVTWGAGYVKSSQKQYFARFNDVYFLTDPNVFITDHFPYMENNYDVSSPWQLLHSPLSKEEFIDVLNMDTHGKRWGLEAKSHVQSVLYDVEHEIDILVQHTHHIMSDYLAYLYKDGRKFDQYTYTYKVDRRLVNIHVCFPTTGKFELQIFGRRKIDSKVADFHPLMKYSLYCTKALISPTPFPPNYTNYGPVSDFETYGVSDVGPICYIAEQGEVTIALQPTRDIDPLPRLYYGDNTTDLREFSFVNFSEDFTKLNIMLRLPYQGYYKLVLFGKQSDSKSINPFVTYLIESKSQSQKSLFPVLREHALKFKCCLLTPLTKAVDASTKMSIRIKSPILSGVRVGDTFLKRVEKMFFEGNIVTPAINSQFNIDGIDQMEGRFHSLYTFNT